MRTGLKVFLCVLISFLIIVLTVFLVYYVKGQTHYFPMSGEVSISDKLETDSGHYIIILQGEGGTHPAQFVLFCTQEQYDSVQIGDTVNCERYQTQTTYSGVVQKIG